MTEETTCVVSGSVDARAFTSRLKLLKQFAEKNYTIPILNCCTIEFEPVGRMKLSHYGLDMAMEASLEAEGAGRVCVPLKTLYAFVSSADGDTLTINKKAAESGVTFRCGRFNMNLVPLPAADIPIIPVPTVMTRGFATGEGVLSHLLTMCLPFVSTEETRYYLNGVCFEVGDNTVRAIATDGHKLGTRQTSTPAPVEAWDYHPIVPNPSAIALAGIIGKAQCIVRFNAEKRVNTSVNQAGQIVEHETWAHQLGQFSSNDWTITVKLIDGTFPDWRRVVPVMDGQSLADIDVADIKRIGSMASGMGGRAVKLAPSEAGVSLTVKDADDGTISGDAKADVSAPFDPIGVNVQYLNGVSKAFGSKRVRLAISGPGEPILMSAAEMSEDEFAVLMPMRV
jgi:DNA polymerase-3 subunit beta